MWSEFVIKDNSAESGQGMTDRSSAATHSARRTSSVAFFPLPFGSGASWLFRHGEPFSGYWWAGVVVGVLAVALAAIAIGRIRAAHARAAWALLPGLAVVTMTLGFFVSLRR